MFGLKLSLYYFRYDVVIKAVAADGAEVHFNGFNKRHDKFVSFSDLKKE
jgi:hypothetical protein